MLSLLVVELRYDRSGGVRQECASASGCLLFFLRTLLFLADDVQARQSSHFGWMLRNREVGVGPGEKSGTVSVVQTEVSQPLTGSWSRSTPSHGSAAVRQLSARAHSACVECTANERNWQTVFFRSFRDILLPPPVPPESCFRILVQQTIVLGRQPIWPARPGACCHDRRRCGRDGKRHAVRRPGGLGNLAFARGESHLRHSPRWQRQVKHDQAWFAAKCCCPVNVVFVTYRSG